MAIQLHIPEPCGEKWANMTPVTPDCRHCAACDRPIVDFSQKTDREILDVLNQNHGKICGRFNRLQLQRPIGAPIAARRGGLTAVAASVAAVLAAQQPLENQQVDAKNTNTPTLEERQTLGKVERYNYLEGDSLRTISGRLIDDKGEPFIGAILRFSETEFFARTNLDGDFTLKVPLDTLRSHPLNMKMSYYGYAHQIVLLPETVLTENIALLPEQTKFMWETTEILTGDILITNWREEETPKWRRFFKRLFHRH